MSGRAAVPAGDEDLCDLLQKETFTYFLRETNSANGLVTDKTAKSWPASTAAMGLALSAFPVGVERKLLDRGDAVRRVLTTLEFLRSAPQGEEPNATGNRGLFYHFLDMETGRRAWRCEVSTVDSAFLIAGVLAAMTYFDGPSDPERRIRELGREIWERADWEWAFNGGPTLTHGWKPESGFLPYRWQGYNEALLLYVLALASPTHPIPPSAYSEWAKTYSWKTVYGQDYLYAGPLFIHQLSHVWIDFRGIQDAAMRERGLDYFENSRRASFVHQAYAIRNPRGYALYGEHCWGITASDGPGDRTLLIDGVQRRFYDYIARGVPFGPDDGTLAPWSVVASLPFAPEIVLPTIRYFIEEVRLKSHHPYGFEATFNPTFPVEGKDPHGWVSPWAYGLNQGPIVLMIENFRTGFFWDLMKRCEPIRRGLRRAGFSRGWLEP